MEIKLILRTSSAYYSQPRIVLAENETLTVELIDKGQVTQTPVLVTSDGVFAFKDNKITLTAEQLGKCFSAVVQDREFNSNKVINRWNCENLYSVQSSVGDTADELISEREFYHSYITQLIGQITALENSVSNLTKEVNQLKNGKFTILKFKEEN